ncbi:14790_t:CDS:2, partial [Gigaspora rosea]
GISESSHSSGSFLAWSHIFIFEYIIDEGHEELEIKLLDKDYELSPVTLIKKDINQEIKTKELFKKKVKTHEPKSIFIQNKAEIYILKEWKEAFLNKKLEPRKYPKLLELAVKHKELQEFINQISKKADLKLEIFYTASI